ncbi:MAG: amino acid racemase [Candidatus Aenigmatarchaeota archaeon]
MRKKSIGILGGMGPEATADIYLKIIKIFQKKYGAVFDKDYPPVIIYSLPIPDVVKEIENKDLAKCMVLDAVKKLESCGADFIILACNTINVFLSDIEKSVSIQIVNTAKETGAAIKNRYKTVGLLSTTATSEFDIFDQEFEGLGIKIIKPDADSQKILTDVILNILGGKKSEGDKKRVGNIIKKLSSSGAEAVVLGCTDLPLLIDTQYIEDIEIIDTNNILAEAAVKKSMN